MEQCGLFESDNDTSGSEWSPSDSSKEAKRISKAGLKTSQKIVVAQKSVQKSSVSQSKVQSTCKSGSNIRQKIVLSQNSVQKSAVSQSELQNTSKPSTSKAQRRNPAPIIIKKGTPPLVLSVEAGEGKTTKNVIKTDLKKESVAKKLFTNVEKKVITEYIPQLPQLSISKPGTGGPNNECTRFSHSPIKNREVHDCSNDGQVFQSPLMEKKSETRTNLYDSKIQSEKDLVQVINIDNKTKSVSEEQNLDKNCSLIDPKTGLLESPNPLKYVQVITTTPNQPDQNNILIKPVSGQLEPPPSEIANIKSHEMDNTDATNSETPLQNENFYAVNIGAGPSGYINDNNRLTLKRKLINPETGALEDDIDDKPNNSIPAATKRKLLNPETGIFEEVDETDIEDGNTNKGKKKRKTPKLWTRNKAKEERLKDHEMREIPNCRCKCKTKINRKEAKEIFEKFTNMSSHTEQNIYLQGCIKEDASKRFRPRRRHARNRRVFSYMLNIQKKSMTVCSSTFLAIHGIKRDRLKKKVLEKQKDISDGRGKHDNHPKKIPKETIDKVHDFISNLPTESSHYCRTDNKHRKYLAANLSIAKLHRFFLKTYPDLNNILHYDKFREIFNHDFNLSFGTPRKDICNVCEKYKVDIKSAELAKDDHKVQQLKSEKELHLTNAQEFFDKLKASETNTDDHVLSLCFDYQKNLPLPVTNVQDEYYRRQLWLHNFGIHNIKEGTATMYLYTENYAHKGPNEVITALDDYLKHNKKPEHTMLNIFCDNCYSQNKNRYLFAYLDQLCSSSVFENVTIIYPIPGHSMMPIDRDFAQIERKRLKEQTIYTPEFYVDLIKTCRITKPYEVVFIEKNLRKNEGGEERTIKVKDYKKLYDTFVKTVPGISATREVKFSKNRSAMRNAVTGHFKQFSFYRVGVPRFIRSEPDDAYDAPLKLKPGKIKDIKHLLTFVDEEDRYFYADILNSDEIALECDAEGEGDDSEEDHD